MAKTNKAKASGTKARGAKAGRAGKTGASGSRNRSGAAQARGGRGSRGKSSKKNRRRAAQRKEQRRAVGAVAGKVALVVALLGVCAVLPVFVNNVIGYVPLIVMVVGILGAFVYLQFLKRGLTFREQSNASSCERDTDIDFKLLFRNKTPLFFFRVEAYFFVNDLFGNKAATSKSVFALGPFEKTELGFTVKFDHIGSYKVGIEKVVICDYLRLFTHTMRKQKPYEVSVIPKSQEMARLEFSDNAIVESSVAARSILHDSMDYAYVRDYVPGDPFKTIHWKLSARKGKYLTRLYEVYTNPGVAVLLDFFAPSDDADEMMSMFDCIVETGLSTERFARSRDMDVHMLYEDKEGRRARHVFSHSTKLSELVGSMPNISNSKGEHVILDLLNDEMTSTSGQSNIVVCSANLSVELVNTLVEAKSRNRNPILFAVVPRGLVGREREDYTAVLRRLDAADVTYIVLADSSEVTKGGAR